MPRDVARRKMSTKAFLKSRDQRKRVEMRFAHLKTHHRFDDFFDSIDPELNSTRRTLLQRRTACMPDRLVPDNHRSSSSHPPTRCRERLASGGR